MKIIASCYPFLLLSFGHHRPYPNFGLPMYQPLSKIKRRFVVSLRQKKERDVSGFFVAEGKKIVHDLLTVGLRPLLLVGEPEFLSLFSGLLPPEAEICQLRASEWDGLSAMTKPPGVLCVFEKPCYEWSPESLTSGLSLLLVEINDPGNLGTILRTADWFGVSNVFCTPGSVDVFNPKAVHATMGAIARVHVHTVEPVAFIETCERLEIPVYGTFLSGESIYGQQFDNKGIIVLGNEARGIPDEIALHINRRLFIPGGLCDRNSGPESLNLASAAAVVVAEFFRQAAIKEG